MTKRQRRRNRWRVKLRRCYQCQHYKAWRSPGTWAYPEEWGWDCKIQRTEPIPALQEESGDDDENLLKVAAKCPHFTLR